MSQENVGLIRTLIERWNAGDRSIATEFLDPAVELESPFASELASRIEATPASSNGYATSTSSSLSGNFISTTCVPSATGSSRLEASTRVGVAAVSGSINLAGLLPISRVAFVSPEYGSTGTRTRPSKPSGWSRARVHVADGDRWRIPARLLDRRGRSASGE